jgi:hypothetical protein
MSQHHRSDHHDKILPRPTTIYSLIYLSLTTVSTLARSWQAELLAQVAKDGRRNTMRTIVIRAVAHIINKGHGIPTKHYHHNKTTYMSTLTFKRTNP